MKRNLCLYCDCYDPDMGCTMPSCDRSYACPLEIAEPTEFFIPMIPPTVTAQEHQVTVRRGKPIFYDTPQLKDARAKLMAHLSKHKPEQPYTDAIRLTVKWCFPRGEHRDGEYRTTKPDTDNLQKLFKDCMTKTGFWKDDALVVSEIVEKFWAEVPGIYVKVESL